MRTITTSGRNIDEAIEAALQELGASREEVVVNPIDTGTRGFLGIFGRRNAQVEVDVRPDDRVRATVVMRNLLRRLELNVEMTVQAHNGEIEVSLGRGSERLRGNRGMTIQSLEYLVGRIINQGQEDWTKVVIDAGQAADRGRDKSELSQIANSLAEKALQEGSDQKTEPLSAQERRMIHLALKDHPKLTTFSVGRGTFRRVIVALREGVPERRVELSERELSRSRYADGRTAGEEDSSGESRERGSRGSGERGQGRRGGQRSRGGRPRGERNERGGRGGRTERPERGEQGERPERTERSERAERGERGERGDSRRSGPPRRSRGRRGRRPEGQAPNGDAGSQDAPQDGGTQKAAGDDGSSESKPAPRRRRRGSRGRSGRGPGPNRGSRPEAEQ